jgi:hypothetical protein
MVNVKSVEDSKKSMTEAAGTISARYQRGTAGKDWLTPAGGDDAENLYDTKVQQAASNKTRQKAIQKLTNAAWLTPVQGKGKDRIMSGFQGGIDKWGTNTKPYLDAMGGVTLPAKTADGHANLVNRAGAIVDANIAKKKELQGG